jgi:hypothetical protein
VATKNSIRIEIVDAARYRWSASAPMYSLFLSMLTALHSGFEPGGFAIGGSCSTPSDQCAAKVSTRARLAELGRPFFVGVGVTPLVRLALGAANLSAFGAEPNTRSLENQFHFPMLRS